MHSAPGTCVSVRNNPHRFGTEVGGGEMNMNSWVNSYADSEWSMFRAWGTK